MLKFIAGFLVGALCVGATILHHDSGAYFGAIVVGDQKGLPDIENGQFRIRTPDGFCVGTMTHGEYLVISKVVGRFHYYKNYPPPPVTVAPLSDSR